MAQLEVRFTLKGETNETTFKLSKDDNDVFWLKGFKDKEKEICIPVSQNPDTQIFIVKKGLFEEDEDEVYTRLLELLGEWIEIQEEGLDVNDDIPEEYESYRYSPDNVYVERKDFSIQMLMELIKEGDLEINPNFQRNFVWDKTRQSKLIESILLGLPLPSVYLSQYPDGRLTIVDGLQRITTIKQFMEDKLVLCNMEYFKECNGFKYSELKGKIPLLQFRKFRQTQIMCFVIDYRSPVMLKYDLFRRLNTGGKALNDQEIRNCMSRPKVQKLLLDMIRSLEFKKATNSGVKDTRLAAQECALRYIYFYDEYSLDNPIGGYNGYMRDSLNWYIDILNGKEESKLRAYHESFTKSMEFAYRLFGEAAFRKINPKTGKKSSVNKSLMLAISVLLAHHGLEYQKGIKQNINLVEPLNQLLRKDNKLNAAITSSTTQKANIAYTIQSIKNRLFDIYLR